MLDEGFEFVERLVEPGFERLLLVHLGIKSKHRFCDIRGQGFHPLGEQGILGLAVAVGFQEGGDVACEAFAQVVDETHRDDLVDVGFWELVLQQKSHQRDAPAVFGHAFDTTF